MQVQLAVAVRGRKAAISPGEGRSISGVLRIRAIFYAAVIAGFASAANAQGAATSAPAVKNVCLQSYLVDHTTTVNPSVVLFHMRNGTVWKNTLPQPCRGLAFHGFVYETKDEQICSDKQPISVIETHQVCTLGAFTPYTPPPHAPAAVNTP